MEPGLIKNNFYTIRMKTLKLLIAFVILLPFYSIAQQDADTRTALLIIDVQEFYFPGGFNPLVEPENASQNATVMLEHFRSNDDLVVHIKHATEKDSLIHQNVQPEKGEKVIKKSHINSYQDTDLLAYLKDSNINQVVICGMMTHMCVEAVARASADFSFDVIVIDDACATRDVVYNNDTVIAADVHNSTLGTINRYYGKVMTVKEYTIQ